MVSYREELVTANSYEIGFEPGSFVRRQTYQTVTFMKPEGLIQLEPRSHQSGELVLNLPDYAQESTKIKIVISVQKRQR